MKECWRESAEAEQAEDESKAVQEEERERVKCGNRSVLATLAESKLWEAMNADEG